MSEKNKVIPAAPTTVSLSSRNLPSSSGAWWGSPTTILQKDAAFTDAHRRLLECRAQQGRAYEELILSRVRIAKVLATLATLPELCRREQVHELRMLTLKQDTEATIAATALSEARARLRGVTDTPSDQPSSTPETPGLFPSEVEQVLERFPDLKPELIEPIIMTLRGLMAEKKA